MRFVLFMAAIVCLGECFFESFAELAAFFWVKSCIDFLDESRLKLARELMRIVVRIGSFPLRLFHSEKHKFGLFRRSEALYDAAAA